jgi:hypothetical protein
MEIKGRIIHKSEIGEHQNSEGDFSLLIIVVEEQGEMPQRASVSFYNSQAANANLHNIGDLVSVNFKSWARDRDGKWHPENRGYHIVGLDKIQRKNG